MIKASVDGPVELYFNDGKKIETTATGAVITGICTATSFEGDGSALTGIAADKIFEGNTEAEVVDTGSDGHFKVTTEGSERLRIDSDGDVLVGGHTSPITTYQSSQTRLSIHKESGSGAYLEIGGAQNTNGTSAGTILFLSLIHI